MLNEQAKKIDDAKTVHRENTKVFSKLWFILIGIGALCLLHVAQLQKAFAQGEPSTTLSASILEVPSSDDSVKLTFPLYKLNHLQYFSAGVGVEERNANYPPYPLKLIFVQGERAFLAEVTIAIAKSDGTSLADIPSEHVMGPWLFVELPSGTYTITAKDSHQRTIKKEVQVAEGRTTVVHFRWPAL